MGEHFLTRAWNETDIAKIIERGFHQVGEAQGFKRSTSMLKHRVDCRQHLKKDFRVFVTQRLAVLLSHKIELPDIDSRCRQQHVRIRHSLRQNSLLPETKPTSLPRTTARCRLSSRSRSAWSH